MLHRPMAYVHAMLARRPRRAPVVPPAGGLLPAALVVLLVLAACRTEPPRPVSAGEVARRVQVHPAAADLLLKGQQALLRQDFRTALAMADSAARHMPDLADVHFLRGNVYTALSRVAEAEAAFERVLALDPDYQGARLNLGNLALRQGRLRRALGLYEGEQARYPEAATLLYIGRAYVQLGRPDSARLAYEQALTLEEAYAPAYIQLAQLAEDGGDLQGALRHAQQALAYAPDRLGYRYHVGALLFRTGALEASLPHLAAVIEAHPGHYGAYSNLGQALARLGRREEARQYLARADSLQGLQGQIDQARAMTERRPEAPEAWMLLGQVLRAAGRYAEAAQAYEVALFLDPDNLPLQNNLASLALAQGNTTEAIQRYHAILQRDSTLVEVWLNLGVVYARSGDRPRAKQAWVQALRLAPEHPSARAYLAAL